MILVDDVLLQVVVPYYPHLKRNRKAATTSHFSECILIERIAEVTKFQSAVKFSLMIQLNERIKSVDVITSRS